MSCKKYLCTLCTKEINPMSAIFLVNIYSQFYYSFVFWFGLIVLQPPSKNLLTHLLVGVLSAESSAVCTFSDCLSFNVFALYKKDRLEWPISNGWFMLWYKSILTQCEETLMGCFSYRGSHGMGWVPLGLQWLLPLLSLASSLSWLPRTSWINILQPELWIRVCFPKSPICVSHTHTALVDRVRPSFCSSLILYMLQSRVSSFLKEVYVNI